MITVGLATRNAFSRARLIIDHHLTQLQFSYQLRSLGDQHTNNADVTAIKDVVLQ
jgi:hypothetical protein